MTRANVLEILGSVLLTGLMICYGGNSFSWDVVDQYIGGVTGVLGNIML